MRKGDMIKHLLRIGVAASLGAALLVVLPVAAGAAPKTTTCDGGLASGSYQKVVVPDGAACFIDTPVNISGGLSVGAGATLVIGDEEHPGDNGTITGGVMSRNAASVQIHFMTINGGVDLSGGASPFGITWNTLEDNHINGRVSIEGYNGFWMGFIRNVVNGSVKLNNNVLMDPDGNEYVTNTIHGSLDCNGNSPEPQLGDSEGSPNVVSGAKKGQCKKV
jgi:hypothetical protein